MSSKRASAPPNVPSRSKKPCVEHAFSCLNPYCGMSFVTEAGRNIHMGKAPECFLFALSHNNKAKSTQSMLKTPPVYHEQAVSFYPWDDDDDDENENDNKLLDQQYEEGSNNQLAANEPNLPDGTYSESAHEASMRFGIRFTKEQYHETKLLKLLSNANAPHYLYKDIIEWGQSAQLDTYDFDPQRSTRNGQIKYLEKWLKLQNSRPQELLTTLPGPLEQSVQTTCFNFTNQLYSLVSDRVLFGNLDNLDVNNEDIFGKYVATNGLLSTINSGQWYHNAYLHEVTDPGNDFLMPIIMACDETHLRQGGKAASWPIVFTTSILNQKMRNRPIAWRTLGY